MAPPFRFAAMAIAMAAMVALANERATTGEPRPQEALPQGAVVRFGRPSARAEGPASVTWLLQLFGDGTRALTWGNDHVPRIWDLNTGKEIARIEAPVVAGGLVVTPDGNTLLARIDSKLRAFDIATGGPARVPDGMADAAGDIHNQPGDGRSVVLSDTAAVTIWEWPEGRRRATIDLQKHPKVAKSPRLLEAILTPSGKLLVTRGSLYEVNVWDAETGAHRAALQESVRDIERGLAFLDHGRYLALMASYPVPPEEIEQRPAVWRPGSLAAARLGLWDLGAGKLVRPFDPPGKNWIRDIVSDPGGYVVATAHNEGFPTLFEVASGEVRRRLPGENRINTAVAFTPDGQRLVTVGGDKTGLVWDVSLKTAAKGKALASPADFEAAWTTLAHPKASAAYDALITWASDPDRAIDLLRKRLRPAPLLDRATLNRIVDNLDSDRFITREKAMLELDTLGRVAVAPLRARLKEVSSLEANRRVAGFFERFDTGTVLPSELREVRSLEFLEQMATPAARAMISELGKGEPIADLTIRAQAASGRLERRKN
jgi:WD40 repeat protein